VLGYLAAAVVSAVETAAVVGGISALAAALYSIGIPHDSVLQYEADVAADAFVVVVHGSHDEVEKARDVLGASGARRVDSHIGAVAEAVSI